MKLDPNNSNRSYLFGRLLAVLDYVESLALKHMKEERTTNAMRLQSAFVNHPMQTLQNLKLQVNPYYAKLHKGTLVKCENKISEIMVLFREEDIAIMNKKLDENYLLGYYLQRMEMWENSDDKNDKNDDQNMKGE